MKLGNLWSEIYVCTTMGADDDRVFARRTSDGTTQIAYWSFENIKIVELKGIEAVCEAGDFHALIEEYGEAFEIALYVNDNILIAVDASDNIIPENDDIIVLSSGEYDTSECDEDLLTAFDLDMEVF